MYADPTRNVTRRIRKRRGWWAGQTLRLWRFLRPKNDVLPFRHIWRKARSSSHATARFTKNLLIFQIIFTDRAFSHFQSISFTAIFVFSIVLLVIHSTSTSFHSSDSPRHLLISVYNLLTYHDHYSFSQRSHLFYNCSQQDLRSSVGCKHSPFRDWAAGSCRINRLHLPYSL